MKIQKSFIAIIALLALAACAETVVVPVGGNTIGIDYTEHPKHATYQSVLDAYRTESNSPGALLLVARAGEEVWVGASGVSNLAHQTQMKNTMPFRAGSITKMFTAVAILKLVEQDRLTLESKLSSQLPETIGQIPSSDQITVRHLLAHLSGIIDPPNQSLRYRADLINNPSKMYAMSIEETLDRYVYDEALNFTPGTSYSYSNANYWLLGKIIERITTKTLQQAMEELIFTPLQLTNTYIEKRNDDRVIRGYADLYSNGALMDVTVWDRAEADGEADGGMVTTTYDLYRFMHGLFNGQLISLPMLAEMKKVQLGNCQSPDCEYGLGLELWRTEAGIAYGHNGSLAGLEANALYYESSGSISVLFKNNGNGSRKGAVEALMK